ncbi:hypothetical protein F5884DRAFT_752689 [Xylogone sp. PMI_703]|nr:hypothetical protein F5884DRAFT_752689 [Xylogone sp. PMI_703]
MDSLPRELLELILLWDVRMCRCEKNTILSLRGVCKAFDAALKPYVFKTVQLEFSRFLRTGDTPIIEALERIGSICNAIYIDMMVIRDAEEITRLNDVFQGIMLKVPEMGPLLESLGRYCMNQTTFDETDYRERMNKVLSATPNLTRLKLNLPFQVVGRTSHTSTILLATTFACVAQRPEEYRAIETLVIDHVSDTTLNKICNNPVDVSNTLKVFAGLKNLVISIKRQESRTAPMTLFTRNLWFLIQKATYLESLCIIGWNVKRDASRKHTVDAPFTPYNEWQMRSLPYDITPGAPAPTNLRYLELKRVDMDPVALMSLLDANAHSLKELYLNEVYIKIFGSADKERTCLWIGHGPDVKKPEKCIWIAEEMRRNKNLKLDILRATGLGYDDFDVDRNSPWPNYDLMDPNPVNRSFDQRFVEAALGIAPEVPTSVKDGSSIALLDGKSEDSAAPSSPNSPPRQTDPRVDNETGSSDSPSSGGTGGSTPASEPLETSQELSIFTGSRPITEQQGTEGPVRMSTASATAEGASIDEASFEVRAADGTVTASKATNGPRAKRGDYDAETFQRRHNTTSHFKRCIDGYFFNHNEQALKELQRIITVADRGMQLLAEEIQRNHALRNMG